METTTSTFSYEAAALTTIAERHARCKASLPLNKRDDPGPRLSHPLTTSHALADVPFGIGHDIAEAHSDPTRFAIRAAVREIGRHLYCRSGADAVREALANAQLDDRFRDAADRFWNGIGDWAA